MTARSLFLTGLLVLFTLVPAALADELPTATVLCYHIIESPQDPRMEISREVFHQQMRYLAMTGYNVIPLRELYDFVAGRRASIPKNAVVITFDDGWRSTYTEVFPEMQRYHFPFTLFIYPNIIGQTPYAMTWKQIKQMSGAGVDVQSHSYTHGWLTRRRHPDWDQHRYEEWLTRELIGSRQLLEKETGHPVTFLAYPYGDYDTHLAENAARAGYAAALTCDYGRVKKGSDPLRMKRVAIDKRIDFATFRHLLGAGQLRIQDTTPLPGPVVDDAQPIVISAKIPGYKTLDPKSVGMTLLSVSTPLPYSYDPRDGSISIVLKDVKSLVHAKVSYIRALVWGNDAKGHRVEGAFAVKLPQPPPADPELAAGASPAMNAPVKAGPSGTH
jgi:peptidoglycan/xylan/chitin deacetylase (PgdA/CDA1 family)